MIKKRIKQIARLVRHPVRSIDRLRIQFLNKKIAGLAIIEKYCRGKSGLEIGGPSRIFRTEEYIPIYALAEKIDGCNFSTWTMWENQIKEGQNYYFGGFGPGYQYIREAIRLNSITDNSYDFILSSHSLEHIANPLRALKEWLRVLRKGGVMLVVVPDRKFTFDHRRPVTTFEHLMDDYIGDTAEDDMTHLEEILSLHDLSLDPGITEPEAFKRRSMDNFNVRGLHHHVFDIQLLRQIFNYLNLETVLTDAAPPFNLTIVGIKK